jgi:hypothetical protein
MVQHPELAVADLELLAVLESVKTDKKRKMESNTG